MLNLSDTPMMAMLREQMSWLAERQSLLSQNVANADVQGYVRHDLKPLDFSEVLKNTTAVGSVSLATTNPQHLAPQNSGQQFEEIETGAGGKDNTVSDEQEMMNVSDTQAKYQAAANIYYKSLQMMRTAIDR